MPNQARLIGKGFLETGQAIARCVFEQPAQLGLQPMGLQVEGRVGEAAGSRRTAIVDLARLQQKRLTYNAAVQGPTAVELLNALLRKADEVAVMPMRIVGMAFEMRADGLDACFGIQLQVDPAAVIHVAPGFWPPRIQRRLSTRGGAGELERLCSDRNRASRHRSESADQHSGKTGFSRYRPCKRSQRNSLEPGHIDDTSHRN